MKNINDIQTKPGWKKNITSNNLIIEKVVEFDIMTYMDIPYFAAPISIHPISQELQVFLGDFRAWHTDQTLGEAIEL